VQLGITSTVGLGFDLFCPCSIQGECDSFDTFQYCFGEDAGFANYVLDFWVDHNTGYDVSKLFIPGTVPGNPSTISPTVINYNPPIPAGTPIHVELNIDVPPGRYGPMEIPIGLMSKDLITGDLFECCATSVSFGNTGFNDCNSNSSTDECDISSGTSNDCNNNGIPDECENCSCCNDVMSIGDPNGDGAIDIGDAIAMLGYLFNQVAINCVAASNVNGDMQVDIGDPARLAVVAVLEVVLRWNEPDRDHVLEIDLRE